MDVGGVKRFLRALDVRHEDMVETAGWINTKCPMGPYAHAHGEDQRASFGISVDADAPSTYYCFGCSPERKRLHWLLHNLFIMTGAYPFGAAKVFLEEEVHEAGAAPEKSIDLWEREPAEEVRPLPPVVLRKYPMLQGSHGFESRRCKAWLLNERRVPEWVQNMCRVRFNEHKSTVIFPLTDPFGNIFVMRERSRKKKSMWTVSPKVAGLPDLVFPSLREIGAWFGMFLVDWRRTVMLVEGEIDTMCAVALGRHNTVGSTTSAITNAQIDALHGPSYILGFDDDKGGEFACRRVIDRVGKKAVMRRARWGLVPKKNGGPCKDPGDVQSSEDMAKVLDSLEDI